MYKKPSLRKPKPSRKTPRQKLVADNDNLFRHIIYARDNNQCQLAGKDSVRCLGIRQCAHIISRGNYRLRWDLNNAVVLCAAHHYFYTLRGELWWDKVREHFPDKWAYVDGLKNQLSKKDTATFKNVNLYLKQQALVFGVEKL